MKKVFSVVLCIMLTLSLLSSCSKPETMSTLTVGLEKDIVPYCYSNGSGESDGFYVRALRKIALEAGFSDVKFVECSKEELINKLSSGELDCFAAKKESGYDTLLKSDSFFYSDSAFILLSDSEYASSKTADEIKNAKLCSLSGNIEEMRFDLSDVTHFETLKQIKEKLDGGEFDGFAGDYFVARAFRLSIDATVYFKSYPESMLKGDDLCHYLYFKKDNSGMMSSLNNAISSFSLNDASEIAEDQMTILAEKK